MADKNRSLLDAFPFPESLKHDEISGLLAGKKSALRLPTNIKLQYTRVCH